jgi:small GTP-binding protein
LCLTCHFLNMLNSYAENKNKLSNVLAELNTIAVSNFSKEMIQLVGSKLEANIFTLVVVGQFKRGKTTFINALLKADILPTAIIPLTSVITIVRYGDKVEAVVSFNNGSKKVIPIEEIQYYVTEKFNPKNEKNVEKVEIFYPSSYLKNGVLIVDTPGVASVHEHNTKTTYDYLPQADAAIFLVSVDPPLTQAELLFLKDLKKTVSHIFFVQNKIDMVSPLDREEALNFTKRIIEEKAGFENIKIYPLSAKTKSGLSDFEKSLEQFLLEEKGNVLINSSVDKIVNVISEELLLAELEKKSLITPLKELEDKLSNFKEFLSDINQECLDSGRLLTEEIKAIQKDVLERDLEKLKEEKTKWLVEKVDEFAVANKKESNQKFIKLLNEFIAAQIRDIFSSWRNKEEEVLRRQLEKVLSRFVNRMNALFEKVFSSSSVLFGITPRTVRIQETLPEEIEFRFQIEDEADMLSMTLDIVKKMMPKVIAHKIIWKEARERAEMLVDRHCGKLRYDFSQRMEKLARDYKNLFESAVTEVQKDVLQALETGLTIRQKTEVEVQEQRKKLDNRIAKLNKLKTEIQNL